MVCTFFVHGKDGIPRNALRLLSIYDSVVP